MTYYVTFFLTYRLIKTPFQTPNRVEGRDRPGHRARTFQLRREAIQVVTIMAEYNKKYSMYNPINMMKGVESTHIEQLQAQGVRYTQQLLERGATVQSREELAQQSNVPVQVIRAIVGRADLMRLRGVGGDLSLLLQEAGILSCRSFQGQDPERLHRRLAELHIGRRIAYHAPSKAQVRSWMNESQELAKTSPDL